MLYKCGHTCCVLRVRVARVRVRVLRVRVRVRVLRVRVHAPPGFAGIVLKCVSSW